MCSRARLHHHRIRIQLVSRCFLSSKNMCILEGFPPFSLNIMCSLCVLFFERLHQKTYQCWRPKCCVAPNTYLFKYTQPLLCTHHHRFPIVGRNIFGTNVKYVLSVQRYFILCSTKHSNMYYQTTPRVVTALPNILNNLEI